MGAMVRRVKVLREVGSRHEVDAARSRMIAERAYGALGSMLRGAIDLSYSGVRIPSEDGRALDIDTLRLPNSISHALVLTTRKVFSGSAGNREDTQGICHSLKEGSLVVRSLTVVPVDPHGLDSLPNREIYTAKHEAAHSFGLGSPEHCKIKSCVMYHEVNSSNLASANFCEDCKRELELLGHMALAHEITPSGQPQPSAAG